MLPEVAEEIVRLRAALIADGLDAGAVTIQWHLARSGRRVPSVSSIVRLLRRRGLVLPEPRKRPRSSMIRFEAALPNQLWQTDTTHWTLADGSAVEILNFIGGTTNVSGSHGSGGPTMTCASRFVASETQVNCSGSLVVGYTSRSVQYRSCRPSNGSPGMQHAGSLRTSK